MVTNSLFYVILIYFIDLRGCTKINISPNDSAFIKHQTNSNIKEIIFKQPLNDKFKVSVSLGNLHTTKELERSKYKSSVFVDKQHLYLQSNLDQDYFAVNSICKFDHEQLAAYTFDTVCCETTLTHGNKSLVKGVCKLEVSATSSVCFLQSKVSKKQLELGSTDDIELTLTSNVYSSSDSRCAAFSTQLTQGMPQKIVVKHGLQVKWTVTDMSTQFGDLEIGVPVDSIDVNSKTIFPLRIRSIAAINGLNLECSYGADFVLSTISFDGTSFGGEFIPSNQDHFVKIALQKADGIGPISLNPSLGENLVNLEMKVSSESIYSPRREGKKSNNWISCRINSVKFFSSKLITKRSDGEPSPIKVPVTVNSEGFVIIPITTEKTYYSILNEINEPIKLQKNDLTMFSVHSVRDGSLVDVTDKTQCSPYSNASIICPSSLPVPTSPKTLLTYRNWNILLTMSNWQKLITYPVELWQAEDWRTVIDDKILNKIAGWNYFDSTTETCRSVYQVTRCQLLARLVNDVFDGEKVYFGQQRANDFPLFDLTSHLNSSNIQISQENIIMSSLTNDSILIVPKSPGQSDISIVDNQRKKLAFDRLTVDDSPVSVTDLRVSCVHLLNVTQTINPFNPSFRTIIVQSQPTRTKRENCYVKINIVFSDNSVTDIENFPSSYFRIVFVTPEESKPISDLNSFVYRPYLYKSPGKFVINLYEPEKCSANTPIFTKKVNLYRPRSRTVEYPKKTNTTTTTSSRPIIPMSRHNDTLHQRETTATVPGTTDHKGLDTDSLFLSMKILIGLVILVVLIVVLNCVIKVKQRKSIRLIDRQLNHCSAYSPMDKFTTSTYAPIDMTTTPNVGPPHPPLLPPPGPLYNASDSSQLDLTVNATPDIFWHLPGSMAQKNRNSFQMNPIANYHQNRHLPTRKVSPAPPHCDSFDYGYLPGNIVSNNSPTGYNYQVASSHETDSVATGSSGHNCSQVAVNGPSLSPCAPLRWNDNYCSNQFALYYPRATDAHTEPCPNGQDNSSQNSCPSSSWEIKQKPVLLPPLGFANSIDNVCEKSSGVGSLTSTKPDSDCSKKDSGCPSSPKTANDSMSA